MRQKFKRLASSPGELSENKGSLLFGISVHCGTPALFVLLIYLWGQSLVVILSAFFLVSATALVSILGSEFMAPSIQLSRPKIQDFFKGIGFVFIKGALIGSAVVLSIWWALSLFSTSHLFSWWRVCSAVLLTDLAYYCTHRFLNHSRKSGRILRWYRQKHAMHHSVSDLDFLRGNVSSLFDTAVTGFQLPLGIIAFFLQLNLEATLVAYGLVLLLQATHHANYTFNIGLLRFVLMDNHAHKLHHCGRGSLVNHGALFSLWDRLFGTYYENWNLNAGELHSRKIALPIAT